MAIVIGHGVQGERNTWEDANGWMNWVARCLLHGLHPSQALPHSVATDLLLHMPVHLVHGRPSSSATLPSLWRHTRRMRRWRIWHSMAWWMRC